jgi:hypothetical protein
MASKATTWARSTEATFCLRRAALRRAPPAPAGAAGLNPARNRLESKPSLARSPFRGGLAQNGAHPRAHPPPRRELKSGTSCSGRLPR